MSSGLRRAFLRGQRPARPASEERAHVIEPRCERHIDEVVEVQEEIGGTLNENRRQAVRHGANLIDERKLSLHAVPKGLDHHRAERRLETCASAVEKWILKTDEGIPRI